MIRDIYFERGFLKIKQIEIAENILTKILRVNQFDNWMGEGK